MSIAVFNAGSSSLKFGAFDASARPLASGKLEWGEHDGRARLSVTASEGDEHGRELDLEDMRAAVGCALDVLEHDSASSSISAVGQRVVHGGTRFRSSVRIDAAVREELERLSELARLHNPPALQSIDAVAGGLAYSLNPPTI